MSPNISERLEAVRARIALVEREAGRLPQSVQLIAVSKTQPASAISAAIAAGQHHFGENYLQEALTKQSELANMPDLVWHFIGPIQSNKTAPIAAHFDWVHSVDRFKIAQRLSEQRPEGLAPLNICLQVNVSHEDSKSGVDLTELSGLAQAVAVLPRLHLRGLMAIPAPTADPASQRVPFRILRQALESLNIPGLDTLSMGMSDDLEAAIQEGATFVRIGTAVFGHRSG
jgi:pyridoxal phosphate enzyme (YggS family)